MFNWKPFLALSTVALLTACAGPGHRGAATGQPGHGMEHNMQAMQQEMQAARTPDERQAIMMRHMQTMHPNVKAAPGMGQQQMMELCMQHMQHMHGGSATPGGMATPAR